MLLLQGRSSNMPQNLTMDTGHSWDLEKKASGIKDMPPTMVASGILVRHKWWKYKNPGHPVFQEVSPLGHGKLKKKNNRDTIHFNVDYGNIDLLYRTVHAANQLCVYGAVSKWCGPNSGEASQSRPESARKMSPEIQINQEDLKSLIDIPRLPHASGTECFRIWIISIRFHLWAKLNISVQRRNSTSDRERKLPCYNYSWWWRMGKAHFDVQRIYSA